MTHLATLNAPLTALEPRAERIEHRLALPRLTREAGADHYVVIDVAGRHGDSGIVAADWTFDAVLDVGRDALVRIAESSLVSGFGAAAHIFEPFELVTENGLLHIDLVREVPEALKPRKIEIAGKSAIEGKAEAAA